MAPVTALAGGVTRFLGQAGWTAPAAGLAAGPGLRSGRQRRARQRGWPGAGNGGAGAWPG